jgi:hypothetical protein
MASYQYVVKSDERWDNIANAAYGNPGLIEPIVQANPDVFIMPVIPAGTILEIPVLNEIDTETANELLPPWMQ